MALTPSLAAGGLALAAYLDGKYQLRRDITAFLKIIRTKKAFEKAEKDNRVSVWYLLADVCKQYPNHRAVWSREGTYTYAEFHNRTVQYAQWLLEQGVAPGELVALYLQNCPEFMMLWFACLSIGAAPAFINYNLEGKALSHCLDVCQSRLAIIDRDGGCQKRIEASRSEIEQRGIKIFTLDEQLVQTVAAKPTIVPGDEHRANVKGDDPFCLIYTSGTTGFPKGAPFTHARMRLQGSHLTPPFEGKPGVDCVYNSMPLYHGTGGITSTSALVSGLGVAIGKRFSASKFFPEVCDSEATVFVYVGETIRYLLNMPPHPLERKHKLRVGYGNGLRPDVWQRFQERFNVPEINEFFSSSEGMFNMIVRAKGPYLRASVGHHGLFWRLFLNNMYVPVKIDHESGDIWRHPKTGFAQRMPYEEGGEILVHVPEETSMTEFKGYWRSEGATGKKYCRDVFKKGDLYYRTGDALRRTSDGHWYFLDRLGDTYRWKSENVSTAEVGEALGTYPGIAEANVYGVTVPNHEGRAGCAAIYVDPHVGKVDWRALAQHAKTKLPKYAVPVFLRVQKASAHIHNNKQNKVPLRKEGVDPSLAGKEDPTGKEDVFMWLPPGGEEYVPFDNADWEALQGGKARL